MRSSSPPIRKTARAMKIVKAASADTRFRRQVVLQRVERLSTSSNEFGARVRSTGSLRLRCSKRCRLRLGANALFDPLVRPAAELARCAGRLMLTVGTPSDPTGDATLPVACRFAATPRRRVAHARLGRNRRSRQCAARISTSIRWCLPASASSHPMTHCSAARSAVYAASYRRRTGGETRGPAARPGRQGRLCDRRAGRYTRLTFRVLHWLTGRPGVLRAVQSVLSWSIR